MEPGMMVVLALAGVALAGLAVRYVIEARRRRREPPAPRRVASTTDRGAVQAFLQASIVEPPPMPPGSGIGVGLQVLGALSMVYGVTLGLLAAVSSPAAAPGLLAFGLSVHVFAPVFGGALGYGVGVIAVAQVRSEWHLAWLAYLARLEAVDPATGRYD